MVQLIPEVFDDGERTCEWPSENTNLDGIYWEKSIDCRIILNHGSRILKFEGIRSDSSYSDR